MTEMTGEEYFPHDTYHNQWFLFWLITVISGVLLWLSFFRPIPVTEGPRVAISAGYDWFLVLHMPEMPKDLSRSATLMKNYSSWFEILAREGYHPMLLSDIEKRLEQGVGLPERAVVLVFDPAYQHTYETLAPLLIQYRFPALWVSDHTALLRGDRHFIHRHQAQWMVRSGFWDMAYTGDGFWRRATDSSLMVINESRTASWAPRTGHSALNWGSSLPKLNRLDVSPKWSAEELLARLQGELPLEGTVRLGVQRIDNHLLGVVMTSTPKNSLFTFQAPLSSTSANLYWLGTRRAPDIQLDLDIPSFFGEASLWMRSDYKTGQGIGVGFTHHDVYVDQKVQGVRQRLFQEHWTPPSGAIKGRLVLSGNQLHLSIEGAQVSAIALAPGAPSPQGFVRLEVFDPIRGAARVEFVRLTLTSLSKLSR